MKRPTPRISAKPGRQNLRTLRGAARSLIIAAPTSATPSDSPKRRAGVVRRKSPSV